MYVAAVVSPTLEPARSAFVQALRQCLPRAAAVLLLLTGAHARAAEICVNSSALLQVALSLGQSQQSDYAIKIVQGAYTLDFNGADSFDYTFSTPTTITGGYNANCTARVVNPANTTVDFSGSATEVTFEQFGGSPSALLAFDGLTLKHGDRLVLYVGLLGQISDDPGSVRLSNLRITDFNNTDTSTGVLKFPLSMVSHAAEMRLENVQIDHIVQQNGTTSCAIRLENDEDSQMRLIGTTIDLSNSKKLCFGTFASSGNYVVDIDNSIVWGSDGGVPQIATTDDFNVASSFVIHVVNSLFNNPVSGVASVQIVNPLHTDPLWSNPAAGNYHLLSASPAVNSGTVIVPGGLPATDIEGNARWIGSAPDRGAYESPFNNQTNFQVTTTSDSGAGSLRDAITQANSLPNPANISFAIPGACPRTIALASALPSITSPIIIDGSTQPGSSKNDDANAFNATLCVLVKPAAGTIGNGFVVASGATQASLTVRGIGMGGFGQPVLLLGGSNHVIAGNQFGGTVGGIALPGAGLNSVSIGVNASGSLIVGGLNVADRNVIGGASFGGINVQSTVVSSPDKCQIVNNLIGVGPNGNTASPNFTGINLSGSGCSIYANRVVGNSQDAIWINGGDNNIVQRNILGITVNGSGVFNSGYGVHISGGNGNVVGTSGTSTISGTLLANTISYMVDGGVLAASGSNNSVRSNLIHDNGVSGDALDIDLGTSGATANDANDPDAGANNLQNFPLIGKIYYLGTPAANDTNVAAILTASLNSLPGSYRIDAYFSNRCDNGAFHVTGRGHADAYAGTGSVTIPAGSNNANFSLYVHLANVLSTGVVSLTATDTLGNTSEIGSCGFLSNAQTDKIFADGFGP